MRIAETEVKAADTSHLHEKRLNTYMLHSDSIGHAAICILIQAGIGTHPDTNAGPRARAGFMQAELMEPKIHILVAMMAATAKGPSFPQPLQQQLPNS